MVVTQWSGTEPRRRLGAVVAVSLAHVALIAAFALSRQALPPEPVFAPVFDVFMARIPPPSPPVGDDRASGGGAPAAASRVHRATEPPVERTELPAPLVQAPLPELVVGLAALPSIEPALGRGGEGEGEGAGVGKGDGGGSGQGAGPVLISGPRGAVMTANVSPAAMNASPGPYAVLECYIRAGRDRLEGCRVKAERPAGAGVGQAALRKAEEFRYRPPRRLGPFGGRHRQTVGIAFPPPAPASAAQDGGRH